MRRGRARAPHGKGSSPTVHGEEPRAQPAPRARGIPSREPRAAFLGETRKPALVFFLAAVLAIAVAALYSRTAAFPFVNYDDDRYVTANSAVQQGLSAPGAVWAFTSFDASNWHPLTWLSHMLDWQLYGLHAGGHHLTSVLLHAATTALLFLLLVELTGAVWMNAFLAGLFALHPLRVESVAWIAERKDLLCGLFFVLSLWAYALYVRRPTAGRYAALAGAFTLGLMSKPMIVTLPIILLLLDFWPLRRISAGIRREDRRATASGALGGALLPTVSLSRALIEKLPLLALSAAAAAVAVAAQRSGGALRSFEALPVSSRLANALVACGEYVALTAIPRGLAALYPFEIPIPAWKVAASGALLAIVTAVAVALRKRSPAVLVGWLWYLAMLLPVAGLVQIGAQSHADRYTYLPGIGLLIALVHGLFVPLLDSRPPLRTATALAGSGALAILAAISWRQIGFWRSSTALFERAIAVTENNGIAQENLGAALANEGRIDEALVHYKEAVRIRPGFAHAHLNLGLTLLQKGRADDAIPELREALRLDPGSGDARLNLGVALATKGKIEEALAELKEAARILPDDVLAQYNLGLAQQALGRNAEAIGAFSRALAIDPGHAESLFELATELGKAGRRDEAAAALAHLRSLHPGYPGLRELSEKVSSKGDR